MVDSGQVHSWIPRKWPQVTFYRGLKRQTHKATRFPIGSKRGQAYNLTYFLLAYLPPTSIAQSNKLEWGSKTMQLVISYTQEPPEFQEVSVAGQELGKGLTGERQFCFMALLGTVIKT